MKSTSPTSGKNWNQIRRMLDQASRGEFNPLSTDEKTLLRSMGRLEYLLDEQFRIPGTRVRFGWDSIIGLLPGAGDLITACLAMYLVWNARRLHIGRWTQLKMVGNILTDAVVGVVPLVGDLFDIAFRANRKNMRLIMRDLEKRNQRR